MIKYLDLKAITAQYVDEINEAVTRAVGSGWYLKGLETKAFESEYANYIDTRHCVGCGNGLDALTLIIRAYKELGIMTDGDEIIVPANTYIASILAITENRLRPILVEPDINSLQIDDRLIENALTPRTKAVMIVHLYGRCAYTQRIGNICKQHGLKLIEDNAQAHGCMFDGRRTGSLGDASGHSFYPSKNLGALGDAGAVTTDDSNLADVVRALGNYGSDKKYVFRYKGRNSRIDELQTAILRVKLKHLDEANNLRRRMANFYLENIKNELITIPSDPLRRDNVWHIFPVLTSVRDHLRQYLADNGIETEVHYPIAPHHQKCMAEWGGVQLPLTEKIHAEELSLPLNPTLTKDDLKYIAKVINRFEI